MDYVRFLLTKNPRALHLQPGLIERFRIPHLNHLIIALQVTFNNNQLYNWQHLIVKFKKLTKRNKKNMQQENCVCASVPTHDGTLLIYMR